MVFASKAINLNIEDILYTIRIAREALLQGAVLVKAPPVAREYQQVPPHFYD